AIKWHQVIMQAAGHSDSMTEPYSSEPTSPVGKQATGVHPPAHEEKEKQPAPLQTSAVTGGETFASPTPASATQRAVAEKAPVEPAVEAASASPAAPTTESATSTHDDTAQKTPLKEVEGA